MFWTEVGLGVCFKKSGLAPDQRWPESLFQTPAPLLFQNFWIRVRMRVWQFFEF